jgi:hemoglobin
MAQVSRQSLYCRLGGYDKIAALLDGVCSRMMRDSQLGVYFKGHNEQGKRRLRQHFIDFLIEATGGPTYYTGTDLALAHKGLAIPESDFDMTLRLVEDALTKHRIAKPEGEELLALFGSLRSRIVEAETQVKQAVPSHAAEIEQLE